MSQEPLETRNESKTDSYVLASWWPFVGVSMVFTLVGALQLHFWIPDLASPFFVQYLVFQMIFLIFLVFKRKKLQGLAVLPFVIICLYKIIPSYFPPSEQVANSQAFPRVSFLQMNVNAKNTQYERLVESVNYYQPDVVLFEEVTEQCFEALKEKLPDTYRVVQAQPQSDNFGIAIFSKIKAFESRLIPLGYLKLPAVSAVFEKDGKKIEVLGVHTVPPLVRDYFIERNLACDEMVLLRKKGMDRFVLMGDLNNTIWSAYFKDLLKNSGLKDSSQGFGIQPTWHAHIMILSIPIDHCLVSSHFQVLKRETGAANGSDHYPVYVEAAIVK